MLTEVQHQFAGSRILDQRRVYGSVPKSDVAYLSQGFRPGQLQCVQFGGGRVLVVERPAYAGCVKIELQCPAHVAGFWRGARGFFFVFGNQQVVDVTDDQWGRQYLLQLIRVEHGTHRIYDR